MKKRFSVEQIVAVMKQADLGLPIADLICKIGISEQTFYRWKKQYAGLESEQLRGFKQLSEENGVPSRLVLKLAERRVSSGLIIGWLRQRGQQEPERRVSRPRSAIRLPCAW